MSIFLSYLVIPLFLLLLGLNVYLRLRIIKKYKTLRNRGINIETSSLMNVERIKEEYGEKDPQLAGQLVEFSNEIRRMVKVAIFGFVLILIIFLIIYFNS